MPQKGQKGFQPGEKRMAGSGRAPGTPNKTTREAREAIVAFVDKETGRLERLLDKIEHGVPLLDENNQQRLCDNHMPRWIIPPDPAKAFDAIQSVIEYSVPKLARTELTGKDGKELVLVQAAKHDAEL